MTRAYNFCAGPAALPEEVLLQAREEMLDWHGKGLSVMEMSHRSDEFVGIAQEAESLLRELLSVPHGYKVLFLQGGANLQFSSVPLNLLGSHSSADYIDTGIWSNKAVKEAARYAKIDVIANTADQHYHRVPQQQELKFNKDAAYVHYCSNETIGGLEFDYVPVTENGVPLVCDMSSTILSRPIDVAQYDMIYAGAQKNIGPAGLCLVIIKESLLDREVSSIPTMMSYRVAAENDSMYNTPPTFAWYLSGLVFQWLKRQGGVTAIGEVNARKASKLYAAIDESRLYANPIAVANRSWMNVPFTLADAGLEKAFLKEADAAGLLNLKGHRSVGGMRASIYNAVPEAAVDALIDFMHAFEKKYYPV
ncbi:3-phosphoserine/phosphohydroxythreonine transaminase [Pokkaliibacter sp. MBI-7]|uniref:3-phosphoserine/phosphohydroxythreonine transaminase n=1 Tax=Pokkaliibacter sp. MBI-7 TaxID=3040600 RepID=UPI00244D44FD|nr:3-phosphoserine/phosphohydroxythreonine transaminase [Pokkaliibacter sp. MBI-7]MDH2435768.1 3-phosphoserine/phosphohydroxythreonine transaminase [Pokkaliibacter sp. MBI-7]